MAQRHLEPPKRGSEDLRVVGGSKVPSSRVGSAHPSVWVSDHDAKIIGFPPVTGVKPGGRVHKAARRFVSHVVQALADLPDLESF